MYFFVKGEEGGNENKNYSCFVMKVLYLLIVLKMHKTASDDLNSL